MREYTLEKFQTKLDRNISFRKRELTILKTQIEASSGYTLNTFIRTGVVFLYAHWEGFIKEASKEFFRYLNAKTIERKNLKNNYIVTSLKYVIMDCGKSKKSQKHSELFNEVMLNDDLPFRIDVDKAEAPIIDTESNLKSVVFDEILYVLGLDKDDFELKYTLLDESLLSNRNKIAHGENISFLRNETKEFEMQAKEDYEKLYQTILELMDLFKDKLLECVKDELYLKETC
ncbi:MAE_28990/MAE_18760 family HEPN-like nuclease [Bacillus cereus]|nr:MAE_28990/MAE_18760 family HEPN-like nuclease [Bacillus cereus]MEB9970827.1 MAE_28990/MAE_18760 family HEPN-like nuclease [Bacillus cereus]